MTALLFPLLTALLAACLLWQKRAHDRALRRLNEDLDRLLQQGTPLPIDQYREGSLSILANQMEKITLRLTAAADRVQQEKRSLADSLADISHQLRTPMTSVQLALTLLRSPDLSTPRRMELTAELRGQLTRMDWLIETLLKLSKLDAGTIPLRPETVPAAEVVERAAAPLSIPMDVRSQRLYVSCQAETICCDPDWTAEALGNVLKNCMEHTPAGGSISVAVHETPLFTEITVEDTGEGFAPEDLPHLFERFYQGKNASAERYGIGLALARSLIAAQDGIIQAQNGTQGAKFIIKFYKQII